MALTDEDRAFLAEPHFAVVGTIRDDGSPHLTTMWYALEGDELLLSTPRGSLKARHLRRDPRLAICVESGYRYLTLSGTAALDDDPQRTQGDIGRLMRRYMGGGAPPPPGPIEAEATPGDGPDGAHFRDRLTIRLRIERVQRNVLG